MKNDGDLSTEARLNIHCDFLAGKFQRVHGKFNPIVSILPSCPAQIQINGQSVTSNIFQQLVRAYTEPRYIEYLQKRFEWDDSDIKDIAWKCLSIALSRIDRLVLTTKICHHLLPTMHHMERCGWSNSDKCKACDEREDREHLLRCDHRNRLQWRRRMVKALRKKQ